MSLDNSAVVPALPTGGYQIEQSLVFNDNDSDWMYRTPSSDGNRRKWTWSAWVKRGNISLGSSTYLLSTSNNGIGFDTDDVLFVTRNGVGSVETLAKLRDNGSWYHIVIAVDTTLGSASDRVKIYLNGELQSTNGGNPFSQNYDTEFASSSYQTALGRSNIHSGRYFDGYMAEVHYIDGQQLDSSYFGETDEDYGHWKPIRYTGSYGASSVGYYLKFVSGSINQDSSGNGNNFTTSTYLGAVSVRLDSPTNNFGTWNPLTEGNNGTLPVSRGNLEIGDRSDGSSGSGNYQTIKGTFGVSSGKWYIEFLKTNSTNNCGFVGIGSESINHNNNTGVWNGGGGNNLETGQTALGFNDVDAFTKYGSNSQVLASTGGTYASGTIYAIAFDIDNEQVSFYINGTQYGSTVAFTYTESDVLVPLTSQKTTWNKQGFIMNSGQDSSFVGQKTAQGNTDSNGYGDFYYTPPSGYLAMCTANLPDPNFLPSENFNNLLWTGTGAGQSITGVGFQPDWVWTKGRSSAKWHMLYDVVRGGGYYVGANDTQGNATDNALTFDSDGFTNTSGTESVASGVTYAGFFWKAGGTASSNTDGSLTASVSANPDAGFSIMTYNTNGNGTVGHGLNKPPQFTLYKRTDSSEDWVVYHNLIGHSSQMYYASLNNNWTGETTGVSAPTSSVVSSYTSRDINIVAYAFHSVEGYSKFGSYIGNGNSSGTYIYTGFKPSWIVIKCTTLSQHWYEWDDEREPYNDDSYYAIKPSTSEAEYLASGRSIDLLSNGFKCRGTDGAINSSGNTYIYMAFAEKPFKYSTAR
jgi:hypothetical protein